MSRYGSAVSEKPYTILGCLAAGLFLSRVAFTPIILSLIHTSNPSALPLYLAACVTDLLDGRIARHLESTSSNGAIFDASADFFLLATGFTYYSALGLVSPLLPVMMAFSFLQYVLTINAPIKDRLGKHVGTVLFALLTILILFPEIQISMMVNAIGVGYIALSLTIRLQSIRSQRTTPLSASGGSFCQLCGRKHEHQRSS
jgi:hypothetical protein